MEGKKLPSAKDRATKVRYAILAVTVAAAFLLYLHRFCFSYAQQYIKEDLGLTNQQFGWCLSAFFFAYALAQVPSGWLSDRFGARRMLTLYILTWSLFTATIGMATGLVMLLVVRIAVGLGQAGAYPTSAGLLSKWMPFSARGTTNSMVTLGGRMGGGIAPILTVYLIIALVPSDVSPQLTTDDLLDEQYFCFQLNQSNDNKPLGRIHRYAYGQFTDEMQHVIDLTAEKYRQTQRKHAVDVTHGKVKKYKFNKYDDRVSRLLPPLPDQHRQAIAEQLNTLLMDHDFFRPNDFAEIDKEKEADQLIARGVDSLSDTQRQRLHRLLLEAVFPRTVKKLYIHGWRPVMWIFGSLGLLAAGLFWIIFRDRPKLHPWCSQQEVALIQHGRPATTPRSEGHVGTVPIFPILKSRSLWLMCINQFGSNIGWVFLVTWLPRYLLEEHNTPLVQRGWMAAIPLWVGWGGMLLGGRYTDFVARRLGLRWGRSLPIATGRFLGMAAYLSCLYLESPWAITAAFAVVAFATDLCGGSVWAYKQDVGGPYVGSIHGWANMWGNLGGAVSPTLVAMLVQQISWHAVFITCAAALGISGLAALGIDASIPIAPSEKENPAQAD